MRGARGYSREPMRSIPNAREPASNAAPARASGAFGGRHELYDGGDVLIATSCGDAAKPGRHRFESPLASATCPLPRSTNESQQGHPPSAAWAAIPRCAMRRAGTTVATLNLATDERRPTANGAGRTSRVGTASCCWQGGRPRKAVLTRARGAGRGIAAHAPVAGQRGPEALHHEVVARTCASSAVARAARQAWCCRRCRAPVLPKVSSVG